MKMGMWQFLSGISPKVGVQKNLRSPKKLFLFGPAVLSPEEGHGQGFLLWLLW